MRLGLLLGSGADLLAPPGNDAGGPDSTPWGFAAAAVRHGAHGTLEICALVRHGEPHNLAPHRINYRANLWSLKQHGVNAILAINTVGGIAGHLPTGSLVTPHQLVDYTWGRESSFYDGAVNELRHVEFGTPFSPELAACLRQAAAGVGERIAAEAVYAVTQGPRLETAAEIARLARDGCHIVGMTAMPEAVLAAELGLPYAMLALVVNPAAGCSDTPIDAEEIAAAQVSGMAKIARILPAFYDALSASGDQAST